MKLPDILTDADWARIFLEYYFWEDGPICPHCKSNKYYIMEKNKVSKVRAGLYKCADCRKQYTFTVGTIFEGSHLPLHKWLHAIYLYFNSDKKITYMQLQKELNITYRTVYFLIKRLRANGFLKRLFYLISVEFSTDKNKEPTDWNIIMELRNKAKKLNEAAEILENKSLQKLKQEIV